MEASVIDDNNEHMLWEADVADAYRRRPYRQISLEEWVCLLLLAAEREAHTPSYFYGITNAIKLYLEHPAYSPFKPMPVWCSPQQREKNIAELVSKPDPKTLTNHAGKYMSQAEWNDQCRDKWEKDDNAHAE